LHAQADAAFVGWPEPIRNWNAGTLSPISAKSSPPMLGSPSSTVAASASATAPGNCLRTAAMAGSRTRSSLRKGGVPRR
jgi:hypothetical protein